ncbi:hypothetical protein JCM16163A_40940 [Paenibacillus sp. YK5]|nr:hypothetical protein PN4B1_17020 [Paenibacillus naphthalenovorans]SDJ60698.1 hypothetical protein SAMN05421868_13419 [Paenibacillus naphthalenovorans]
MDHFKGINDTERYNNDVLRELRRTNELLEQLALLLKPNETVRSDHNDNVPRRTGGRQQNTKRG